MARSTVHYADNKTNNALKKLHNKLRPAGTPVQRVEYIIELLLLRIFETKIKQDDEFKPLRKLFTADYRWKNPKTGQEESNENRLFSYLPTVSNDLILAELNDNFFPFYSSILQSARQVFAGNLPQKVQDQLVLIEEVFSNSNFTNNVNSGNLGEVISVVANDIEEARLLKTDLLGDAIESALSETGGTKDIGLFRTPDHVRQFMTALVEPNFDDIVFDPACGTGGFLFDAFEFVMRRVDSTRDWPGGKSHSELRSWFDKYFKDHPLEFPNIEQTTQFYRAGVSGIEYLGMIRKMAAINFYIRGLNPDNIQQGDSLAKYDPVTEAGSKTVVIANPPFGAERDQEAYPEVWGEYPKESETTILFVKLMFDHLHEGGRCAVIVSEGFHTWDQNSAKALRKMLLDEAKLQAIISLPQGLFVSKGGQGPKTSILLYEKGGKTDWVWFYKVTNDGYTIGTNRKEQKGNQLVECLDLYHKYVKNGQQPPQSKHQFCIPVEWIKTLDPRIKERIRIETRQDLKAKGDIYRKKKTEDLNKKIATKKITESEKQMELELFDQMLENKIQNEIAKRIDKAFNYSFNLSNYRSTLSESQISELKEALKELKANGTETLDNIYKKLSQANPEDSLPYIAKLNLANTLEADIGREYISKMNSDLISVHPELIKIREILKSGARYPMVKLKEYIFLNENKIKPSKFPDINYKVLGVSNETGIFVNEKLNPEETNQSYYLVKKDQFCYNPYRINVGSIGLNKFDYDNQIISGAYIVFGCHEDLNPKYLDALFKSREFLDYVNDKANGGVRMNFKFADMELWEIPLPSSEEQSSIVEKIEKQRIIVTAVENIIDNWSIDIDYYTKSMDLTQKSLSDLIVESLYGTSEKLEYQENGFNVLRIGNIGFCNFKLDDIKKANLSKNEFEKYRLRKGDFLIVRSNGNPNLVGKCAVWDSDLPFIYASYLIRFRFDINQVEPRYIMYYLMSPKGRSLLNPQAGGGTYNISSTDFQKIQISFPVLESQKKIVSEIDAKMTLMTGLFIIKSESENFISKQISEVWGLESLVLAKETKL
ncbi:MAG: N-6 DNA methylase [Bacteroidales bacterium]|nr:N-6 DNA methylase [Bacteroidales bacterium]